MSRLYWFIGGGVLIFCGVILVAVVAKLREVRAARRWPSTKGRVLKSEVAPRERAEVRSDYTIENVPLVEYEYHVDGERYQSRRISIGEMGGNLEVEEVFARYPIGTSVEVFYNPEQPTQAVLERELPPGVGKGVGCLLAFFIGGGAILLVGVTSLPTKIAPLLPNPSRAPFVLLAAAMGLGALVFAELFRRQLAATKRWLPVRGEVIAAEIVERRRRMYRRTDSTTSDTRYRTHFSPRSIYAYEVAGRSYQCDRIALGAHVSSTSRSAAERALAKYPKGAIVEVFYNPENPGEALLERRIKGMTVLLVAAAAMFALAFWAGSTP